MRDSAWFNLVAAIIAVAILGVGIVAMVYPSASPATAARAGTATTPVAYRNLSIAFNPATGAFDYSTTQLTVPAGVTTIFTITNFDPSVAMVPVAADTQVVGTVGGTMTVASGGHTFQAVSLPANDIAHTFTISSGAYHVNVPIPPAGSSNSPAKVTFSVHFTFPGTFNWGCAVLCGPEGTMARDVMYGTLTVG